MEFSSVVLDSLALHEQLGTCSTGHLNASTVSLTFSHIVMVRYFQLEHPRLRTVPTIRHRREARTEIFMVILQNGVQFDETV